jgi:glycosyltransferase involved in cell wall biosynthesis
MPTMNIAFDAQLLLENKKTGVPLYQVRIVTRMQELYGDFFYQFNLFTRGYGKEEIETMRQLFGKPNTKIHECKWISFRFFKYVAPLIPYAAIFGKKADITHFFDFFLPFGVTGKKIVTVHDMTYKAYPETLPFMIKLLLNWKLGSSCKRADKIVTVSEFSKAEIIKYFHIEPDKIVVVPSAVDNKWYFPVSDTESIIRCKNKYAIPGEYYLYVGTIEPRKNIEGLIDAYYRLKQKRPEVPKLVIAGKKGWLYDAVFKKVEALHIKNDVLFLGYIANEDISPVICGALAFVYPSLYEGFGLPPLEAMACGVPVLTSNRASLPEVVGDAAITVDPLHIDEMAAAMERLFTDKKLREELSRKGLEQAKKFSWETAASKTIKLYEELLSGGVV